MSKPLPLLTSPPPERRDAARNREALMEAAVCLVELHGVRGVTMDALAARAGVGKGTVFRRFGSREGLMGALLNHSETEWQAAVMGGPPPLGPGAPPLERLLAFGESRMVLNIKHAELIEAAGNPGARSFAALSFTTMHVRYLLGQLGVEGDLAYLATALVAPLEMIVLREQVDREQIPMDRITAGWTDLVRRVAGG
ncbi:TetR/AcrR family transcriptional regulator [Nocardioides humilatus]|uniref:TetR/AcrR family transcriptional regulator n=1 Tax=Nocardioides humilatus TaxID=2607660 RepID=A0A5B1LD59_9ACTN|nr:TetR/AcrR family transcriptional regulator [Nocardioides humilatus]KAA1418582.1 TetR/AcrR family transcriptional regulator [Nocardioides humilatus]